ncbi:neuropeptide Y receptor type 2 [Pholidichthys leucotaenia]
MEAVDLLDRTHLPNLTNMKDSGYKINSSNCCLTASTIFDENYLTEDESTQLVLVQIILILAYTTIILFGVIGNLLVIYVVYKFKNLRTVTNFFIVNLAVADLLVSTLCLPFTLVNTLYGEWMFGQVLCFLLPCAQGLAVQVSTITLTIIALDRHRNIVYHMETKMSKDVCIAIIVITWAVSGLLASPLAIFREYGVFDLPLDKSIQVCRENWPEDSMSGTIYSMSMLLVQYCLPLAITSAAYIRIWNKLKNHMAHGRNDRSQRRKKTTKMLLTMVVVFAVSWLPFHTFQLASDIDNTVLEMKDYKLIFTVFHIVAMCSTFANPILYGWMNNNYRMAFLSVFKCCQSSRVMSGCSKGREAQKDEEVVYTDCKSTNV